MIDFLSLILSHCLMMWVAFKLLTAPDVNVEPNQYGRHFKQLKPREQAADESEQAPPGA